MSAQVLSGKTMSESLRQEIASRVTALKERGLTPGLAVILVGNDPASEIYVRNKGRACEEIGIRGETIRMPESTTQQELEDEIERLNREIRRRTRVVGCFPDGNSALMLVCARLRHVAGTQWGNKKYMSMKHLDAMQKDPALAG